MYRLSFLLVLTYDDSWWEYDNVAQVQFKLAKYGWPSSNKDTTRQTQLPLQGFCRGSTSCWKTCQFSVVSLTFSLITFNYNILFLLMRCWVACWHSVVVYGGAGDWWSRRSHVLTWCDSMPGRQTHKNQRSALPCLNCLLSESLNRHTEPHTQTKAAQPENCCWKHQFPLCISDVLTHMVHPSLWGRSHSDRQMCEE